MLRGTKRISKLYSFDESKFFEFVKKNKEKYGVIDFNGDYLVMDWTMKLIADDYKKTLTPPNEKKSKKS
jgi:hypothetical protein